MFFALNCGQFELSLHESIKVIRSLPAGWTSVVPEDPFVVVAAGRSRFRAADLIDLAALLVGLRS